ncbi:MAG TPA: adenosylcobinamide amidohydrolase [Anaerolineales bacterium]
MQEAFWKSSPWLAGPAFAAYRQGRFIVVELTEPHRVMTTSSCVGGVSTTVRHLVNHQSCEASGHAERSSQISALGLDGYHCETCRELQLDPHATAVMGTAANMIYAAHQTAEFGDVRIDAIVTAGVEGNAACAGDPAQWVESPSGWNKLAHVAGTINMIVVVNQPLKPEAQIRGLLTITEGKSAALTELSIPSLYSENLATGTGTDQICFAAPLAEDRYAYTSTSPHIKLGELLGDVVRSATKQALRWQNGLEPSFTRSLIHALKRFGFSEASFVEGLRARLSESAMRLFEKNKNAVLYEPQAAASAYAFASVLDRVRFGVIPASAASDVLRQQAATFAASLAAQIEAWPVFWRQLQVDLDRPLDLIYDAAALGWSAKWQSRD